MFFGGAGVEKDKEWEADWASFLCLGLHGTVQKDYFYLLTQYICLSAGKSEIHQIIKVPNPRQCV